jgi:hypothetical protein
MAPNRKNGHKGYDEKYRKNKREHGLGPPFSTRQLRGKPIPDLCAVSAGQADKSHTHSAEQIEGQENDQNQSDNAYAAARPPSPISVISAATAEHEHQDNDQENQKHERLLLGWDRF